MDLKSLGWEIVLKLSSNFPELNRERKGRNKRYKNNNESFGLWLEFMLYGTGVLSSTDTNTELPN